jgi:hypothetical protein
MGEKPTKAQPASESRKLWLNFAWMAWFALLLCVSFVVICLILIRPVMLSVPSAAEETFASRSAILVYGILLAGVIGSFLRHMIERFGAGSESRPATGSLVPELFSGATLAFVTAFLLPSAMMAGRVEDANVWVLLIVAGVAGYAARSTMGEISAAATRMIAQLDDEAREQIAKSVQLSVKHAISPPKLVSYDGYLSVRLMEGSSDVLEWGAKSVRLHAGKKYRMEIYLTTISELEVRTKWFKHLSVKGAQDETMAPFRIVVDFGDVRTPLAERQILAPRTGSAPMEVFEFTRSEPPPPDAEQTAEVLAQPPPISVVVYQHGMFCEIVEIPQERLQERSAAP